MRCDETEKPVAPVTQRNKILIHRTAKKTSKLVMKIVQSQRMLTAAMLEATYGEH